MIRKEKTQTNQDNSQFRINEQIRASDIRLIGEDFEQISTFAGKTVEPGIYPTYIVLKWAIAGGLDLVEISPNANPPVTKIIDYNKFLYNKKKKEKELKAKSVKTVIKEIRFGPNTDDHDFEFKVKHGRSFLEEGSKVRAYVQFKGRSIVFQDRGELILLKFLKELEDLGTAEALPKLEGKRMGVMIAPKKGVGKK